ncbi:molecular chaperone [Anaeroselena agilis]|uniref:Molecular chaperone TorD family protein n=1 Tax=Anaeroselena agilis TaxID=3063788 RepID=A0ABU3NW11_9FIRM|nr:molecular chaperone TorD family protein [Selenomonadales bacterium 4137-cl]
MEKTAYRKGVLAILAELLQEPTDDTVGELPAMVKYLHEAFAALEYPVPLLAYSDWPKLAGGREALALAYNQSFVFPPETRVVPVESIYRQWTSDSSAQVPFAKEKGYLMSDAALHMKALYESYGLELPPAFSATPDHLGLELEFAVFLLENEAAERQAVFWREHLDWVDELADEAEKNGIPAFYRQVLKVIAAFLRADRENYEQVK